MRPLTALLILAACQCLHADQHPRALRNLIEDAVHDLRGEQSKPVRRIISCLKTIGLAKCVSGLGAWRAERALEALAVDPVIRSNLTEDVEKFPWKNYINISNEQLQSELLDRTQKLLTIRPLTFNMIPGYKANLNSKENGCFNIDVYKTGEVEGRSTMKKMQKLFYQYVPILIAPGLFMSAIVPFILPSMKMIIAMVGFMNQIALAGAVFTVLRNNAFNDKYDHKVVYVNNGYQNEKLKFAASDNEEHFHTNHLGILYEDPHSRLPLKPIVQPPFDDNDFATIEDIPPLSVSPQWIKEYTDGKMIAMLKKQPHDNIYFNGEIPIRRKQKNNIET